ncbi:RNA-directed DNA polymerase, eukaryota, reverse transcriptase zinc-binding domain protein [Tanacetum coccineum]
METLHISFSRAVNDGIFKGVHLHGTVNISHLFYADDAMFIGEWSDSNLQSIVNILNCFFLASGLKINILKSQVMGVGVPHNIVVQAADLIGCTVMRSPFCYLGVMVGECMSRRSAWASTVHKLQLRLSKWKVKTLSIGGRLTLLKSVLGASPLYNLSIFKVPKGVLKDMESIRSHFFNGADSSDRKITWVAWDIVLASKKWRLRCFELSCAEPCSSSQIVRVLKDKGFDFISHCKRRVGDGLRTRFWNDLWISDGLLCDRFPRLFALEMDKEVLVAVKLGASSVADSFRRGVRDGTERQQWSDLSSLVASVSLLSSKDRWICDLTGDGEFKVKAVHNSLDDLFLPSQAVATRWVKFIPIKVNVFAWRARRDRLPTRLNLSRRGVVLDSILYPLCDADVEDFHHVMFRCDMALSVIRKICWWWKLDWQVLSSFSDWNGWFLSIRLPSFITSILEVIIEYLVKINKKARILELKRRHLKITVRTSYMPYPSRKIGVSMSSIYDDLFTNEVVISGLTNIPCDLKEDDDSEQQITHGSDDDMEYDPSNVEFT